MNSGPTLSIGATGSDVTRLQRLFVEMKLLDATGIDGSFGPITEQTVRDFQGSDGLVVDGIVGPATWGALPADPDTPQLASGASGSEVAALQRGLTSYSTEDPATNPGAIDGSFGPLTEASVKAFQKWGGVTADGMVGDQTWSVSLHAASATLETAVGLGFVIG